MNIIAIDDESGALKLLEKSIKAASPECSLCIFSNPFDGIENCKDNPPDVAFLDINMPGMTGLEVAKKIKGINPNVNIIFTTGYSEYAKEAFDMHASGYITKPVTPADVRNELENLRNPLVTKPGDCKIYMKTFGNFDVFANGRNVVFKRSPAKEVLAYLVDRRGSSVNRKELAAVLFEDREYTRATQSYMTQIIKSLQETLKNEDAEDLLIISHNSYAVDTSKFSCDAYDYLNGIPAALNAFRGEYMNQYSWAECSMGDFYDV